MKLMWCLALLFVLRFMRDFTGCCSCPKIYDPVKCANGETYDNECLAKCASKAKECRVIPEGKSHFA